MKLVREHIFEKFEEESDPVHDMGIGLEYAIEDFIKDFNKKHDSWFHYREKDYVYLANGFFQLMSWDISDEEYETIKQFLNYLLSKVDINKTSNALNILYINDSKKILEMTKFILDKGYKVSASNLESYLFDEENKRIEPLKLIIDAGLQQRIKKGNQTNVQKYKDRILILASEARNFEIVKWALDKGADFSVDNFIALRGALENNNIEMIKFLTKELQKKLNF
jgi:hypothetical protein